MLLAFHILGRLRVLKHSLLDACVVGISSEFHLIAGLAVEAHRQAHAVFLQVVLVPCRPRSVANTAALAQHFPNLLAEMRTEWGKQGDEQLHHALVAALQLVQLVQANHEGGDTRVVRELLDVAAHFLDQLVDGFQLFLRGGSVGQAHLAVLVEDKHPQFLQEAVATVDSVRVPWLRLLHRTQEHFVQTQRVGTEALHNHVGIHHVEHGFRHLLNRPATHILAVLQHKLGVAVFRSPSLESFCVEHVVLNDVHVHMDWGHVFVVLSQAERHENRMSFLVSGLVVAIDEVRTSLDHTLVDQLLERLFLHAVTIVVEELVPEPAVNQVAGGMLRSAHIEVHVLPVFIGCLSHQRLVVVRIHIAQVIG